MRVLFNHSTSHHEYDHAPRPCKVFMLSIACAVRSIAPAMVPTAAISILEIEAVSELRRCLRASSASSSAEMEDPDRLANETVLNDYFYDQ
jgi:hypothetical protein